MSERAEGFWWVRCGRYRDGDDSGWMVVDVRQGRLVLVPGTGITFGVGDAGWQWGEYLGKAPSDDGVVANAVVRARAEERERIAVWMRFHGDDEAYAHDITCVCGDWNTDTSAPSVEKLAAAIEAMGDEP